MPNILHMFKKCQLKKHETLCPIKIWRITRKILEPVVMAKNLVSSMCMFLKHVRSERVQEKRGFQA
jgi:hypothetical protein